MSNHTTDTAPAAPAPGRSGKTYETTLSNGYPAKLSMPAESIVQLNYDFIIEDQATPIEAKAVLITPEQEEAMISKNETQGRIAHNNGLSNYIRIRWERNNVPMKDEDRSSVYAFKRDSLPDETKAKKMGAVEFWRKWHSGAFNAPEGSYAAELINRVLHACLAHALIKGPRRKSFDVITKVFEEVFKAIGDIHNQGAITHLDPQSEPKHDCLPPGLSKMISPGALWSGQTGTTVVTAFLDLEAEMLYIANLGDCRAVAGWYCFETKTWECDILSEDLVPENPSEAKGLIKDHPETPPEILIRDRGFAHGTFGFGSHTRSFAGGMQTMKKEKLDPVAEAIGKPVPKWYREKGADQQPYVSCVPDLVGRDLRCEDVSRKLKFVILATDGLWDRLTSEEALLLVAGHLEKLDGYIPKTELPSRVSLCPWTKRDERPYPVQPLPGTAGRDKGSWVFEDTDATTHLIRNAIGDGDAELRRMILSLNGPEAREMRDDMTVTVLFFQ